MPELAGGFQRKFVYSLQQSPGGVRRLNRTGMAGHVGTHITRMEEHDCYTAGFQIVGQGDPGNIHRGLGHSVAVVVSGRVISYRSHSAGYYGYPCAWVEHRLQGTGDPQRAQAIHLELLTHGIPVELVQRLPGQDSRIIYQSIDFRPTQPHGQGLNNFIGTYIDAIQYTHTQFLQFGGSIAANSDYIITASGRLAGQFEPDTSVCTSYYRCSHRLSLYKKVVLDKRCKSI
jgi:hypothetical protein